MRSRQWSAVPHFLLDGRSFFVDAEIVQARSTKEDSWCVLNGNTKGSFENSPLVDTPSKCALNVDSHLRAVVVARVLLFIQVLSRKWRDQTV